MMEPKVSIIVPVYNVEHDLERCVESLINQTLKCIEIILVDDGSTDNCPKICDEYVKRDGRIKVVHKENGGLSDARNVGLKEANGQYVLFVDSDDYISKETCEVFFKDAFKNNLDIVVGDAIRVENCNEISMNHASISLEKILSGSDFIKEQLQFRGMHMAACLNLYRKDFLIENQLFFKKGIYHEDEEWTPRVFLKAKKVKYINLAFYFYIIRENSITKKKDKSKNGIDLINTCYELEKIYEKIEDNDLKRLLNDYLVMLFLNAIHMGNLYGENYKGLFTKNFLKGKALSNKNKFKAGLFIINKSLYKNTNIIIKHLLNLKSVHYKRFR